MHIKPLAQVFQLELERNHFYALAAFKEATKPGNTAERTAYYLGLLRWHATQAAHYGAAELRRRGLYA